MMKRKLVGMLIAGTAMSLLGMLALACAPDEREEAVRNIVGEVAEACIRGDSERLQQLTISEFFECPIFLFFSSGFKILSVTVEDDTAVVEGRSINAIGETSQVTFALVNQGGHWLVKFAFPRQ